MKMRKTTEQKLQSLTEKRAKLAARLAALDSQISKIESTRKEVEMRETLALIKRYNVTPSQLAQMLAKNIDTNTENVV